MLDKSSGNVATMAKKFTVESSIVTLIWQQSTAADNDEEVIWLWGNAVKLDGLENLNKANSQHHLYILFLDAGKFLVSSKYSSLNE